MNTYSDTQIIKQLPKNRGAYYHVVIAAEIINQFEQKRKTRFICTLENQLSFQCGLNHLGDGNFFIILSGQRLKKIGKILGDTIHFELREDPNPLGVEMPEVLTVLLQQDELLQAAFDKLSMGKKRHIIHTIIRIKDIDKQVDKATEMINLHFPKP
ncbi:MAG: YdeI/OmpD-associated family protein [Bacteroidota bacterium]